MILLTNKSDGHRRTNDEHCILLMLFLNITDRIKFIFAVPGQVDLALALN